MNKLVCFFILFFAFFSFGFCKEEKDSLTIALNLPKGSSWDQTYEVTEVKENRNDYLHFQVHYEVAERTNAGQIILASIEAFSAKFRIGKNQIEIISPESRETSFVEFVFFSDGKINIAEKALEKLKNRFRQILSCCQLKFNESIEDHFYKIDLFFTEYFPHIIEGILGFGSYCPEFAIYSGLDWLSVRQVPYQENRLSNPILLDIFLSSRCLERKNGIVLIETSSGGTDSSVMDFPFLHYSYQLWIDENTGWLNQGRFFRSTADGSIKRTIQTKKLSFSNK